MKQFLFANFLKALGRLTGKRIVYFPKDRGEKNLTAVKSDLGFWYAGNILDTSDIAYGVLYNGNVEAEGTRLVVNILKHLLKKSEHLFFYDVGANTGYFGVLAAFVGLGKISTYSFEPVREFNEVEQETLKINGLDQNCQVFNVALGDINGEADILLAGTGSRFITDFVKIPKLSFRKVTVCRLDTIFKQKNLSRPAFIKIDVEGYEFSVFKGGEQTIKNFLPVIWYESALTVNSNNFLNQEFFKTQDFLKNLGYQVFWCGPTIIPAPKENIPDGVSMYLALHSEAHKDMFSILEKLYANS